ncbi:Plasmodium vivax Vir protein, putative [Plasmodium vivax]|uniref:Vir protein, putative n=1 Tax=Plasmodium vivax TaxID=5855 RepID=A0A1G4E2Z9_PLAVI|nr:Plasmodium vivax Vir protein, putative [Plasmodium vivax]
MKFKEEEEDKEDDLGPEGEKNLQKGDSSPSLTAVTLATSISPDDVVVHDLQPDLHQNSQGVTEHSVPDSSKDGKSTGTIISASSVGTVGFLFLLYKFTPLRSMLDPRIRKTRNNLMNGVQGSHELQSQDYDLYSQDAPFNRYNIGYQSS